jgi:pimeloyl-ACP methyl ester carboxylesterase
VSDLRVLCLHGYHGSAEILRRQMAALASSISGVEFVYVDAPSLAVGDFGWWHSPAQVWDRTRDWALDMFATQPRFDGVFGFSQGAAFTGLLAGMQQEAGTTIRFDFAVMVGGFKNDAPQHADLYRRTFALPSLHIIGHADGVIPPNESEDLAHQFENPVVLYHAGGHVVPTDRAVVNGIAKFLERISENRRGTNAAQDAR